MKQTDVLIMKRSNERGSLAACDEDGEIYWFYGWDLTDADLHWPAYGQTSADYEIEKSNVYGRWGFGEYHTSLMYECQGPKQGACQLTRVDII